MELPVLLQLRELLLALALGTGLGLLYDLLRPLRHGRWKTAFTDALYTLLLFTALMLFALYAGRGRLRLFALAAMGCSGGLWLWLVSPLFRRIEAARRRLAQGIFRRVHLLAKRRPGSASNQEEAPTDIPRVQPPALPRTKEKVSGKCKKSVAFDEKSDTITNEA